MNSREQFLKQQRDKLVELKHEKRQKMLLQPTNVGQLSRLASERAADSVLHQAAFPSTAPAPATRNDRTLAMRKVIARCIKSEVIGNDEAVLSVFHPIPPIILCQISS